MARLNYSDEQRAEFLELAAEIGNTRARRQLGFPAAWNTAQRWIEAAGIEVPLDEIKAQASAHNEWYKTEDILTVVAQGFLRAYESLQTESLTPDEQKKLSEAVQKYSNTWLLLQGKANNINESRRVENTDIELMRLLDEEARKNHMIETEKEVES